MCSFELIIKFKNLEINESLSTPQVRKTKLVNQNSLMLTFLYWVVGITMIGIMCCFIIWVSVCSATASTCNFDESSSLLLPISVLNILTWILLLASTLILMRIMNKRFGDSYRASQIKLIIYLSVFSLSFLLRGVWDIIQNYKKMSLGNVVDAITVFIIYFFCEWLPIFVIYLSHYSDFSSEAQPNDS